MAKVCVFIIGTNCVGKTTLAKALIERFGGIKEAARDLTVCQDDRFCLAGKYNPESSYGGVDGFGETKKLAGVVEKALEAHDVIVCEGSFLNSFGMNLTNAMFAAEKHLVVMLYADGETIRKRLKSRSGRQINRRILEKQRLCSRSAQKWHDVGVAVLPIDTTRVTFEKEVAMAFEKITELWSGVRNTTRS